MLTLVVLKDMSGLERRSVAKCLGAKLTGVAFQVAQGH